MPDEDGETYVDALSGQVRGRRGARKNSRGPYSAAEKRMRRQFQYMTAAMHRMDGELADVTADDMTVFLSRAQVVMEKYSYKVTGDSLDGIDMHVVRDELDLFEEAPPLEDVDVYKDLQ